MVFYKVRVKLKKDLPLYNSSWKAGLLGWTVPGTYLGNFGKFDHAAMVRFDNNTVGDIAVIDLEEIGDREEVSSKKN